MPISTPSEHLKNYSDDIDHFQHVLENLFIPAIESADFKPIKPNIDGSDNIQAEIIHNLESADLVLCDMSTQNPNVFFELGIRTSLNKPVCLVKDNFTTKIPFDTSTIHTNTYNSRLDVWLVKREVPNLTDHIKKSLTNSDNVNSLWKYFGFRNTAKPSENSGDMNFMFNLIIDKLNSFDESINYLQIKNGYYQGLTNLEHSDIDRITKYFQVIRGTLEKSNISVNSGFSAQRNTLIIYVNGTLDEGTKNYLSIFTKLNRICVNIIQNGEDTLFGKEYE